MKSRIGPAIQYGSMPWRLAPNAEFVEVTGAGHMVAGDKNDAFADAILTLLG